MKFHIASDDAVEELNISSMVDMTFLLLMYFLVTASLKIEESELRVQIPIDQQMEQQQRVDTPEEVVVDVFENGEIWWNGQPTDSVASDDLPELKDTLADLRAAYPEQAVVVRGQRTTQHRRIVSVLNACAYAGIDQISFPADASVFEE
ncbi:MAG TPA: biopolymer transporter ExbD [Lentisphaeria bacterium]|nr:biopolymer transporter ExbD [Lentisphaeria bacterium]